MIELFLLPSLVVAALVGLMCVLPVGARNALIGIVGLLLCAAWAQYFVSAAMPGHDGGAGEALGLLVMGWISICYVLGTVGAVWLHTARSRLRMVTVSPIRAQLVAGRYRGQTGYVVAESIAAPSCRRVALDSGIDVVVPAGDLHLGTTYPRSSDGTV